MTGTPTADSAAGPVANTKGASADSGVRPAGVSAAAAQEHRQLAALLAAAGPAYPAPGTRGGRLPCCRSRWQRSVRI